MPKKRYKPLPLSNASKIMRAHSTQIDPPGLVEFQNAFQSRSDSAITLRSDWEAAFPGMSSYSADLVGDDLEDYLNAAFHVSRAGYTIYFSRWAPFTWAAELGELFTTYEDGTISSDSVRTEVIGVATQWLQQVWPGCLIRAKGRGNPTFTITGVTSDTRLLTNEPLDVSGEYEILRVHPSTRADWPIKFESLGGFLIYGSVDITQPIDADYISGPFFSNIGRPNLGVWFGTDPVLDEVTIPISTISVGFDDHRFIWPLDRDVMRNLTPVIIAGDKGVVFARNWIGDDLAMTDYYVSGRARETYLVSSGTNDNISFGKCATSSVELVTLAGEIIQLDTDSDSLLKTNSRQYYYPPASEILKSQPFGDRSIRSFFDDFYVGDVGLLGGISGTIYPTGLNVTLQNGCSFAWSITNSGFVVVGDADSTDGVILYFTNPTSINRATTGTPESFLAVTYSRILDRLIAVGTAGECMTSDDHGATWTSRTVGASSSLRAIAADEQGRAICVVGEKDPNFAACYLSMDGITWEETNFFGSDNLVDVTFNDLDGSFYAVSEVGKVYRIRRRVRVPAGSLTLGSFGTNSDFVTDIHHDGTQFVAVGSKIWASLDAVSWLERLAEPSATLTAVAKDEIGGSNWVAVGLGGIIYRSSNDALSWSPVSSPVTVDLVGVVRTTTPLIPANDDFIAIGKEGNVINSSDGSAWSSMPFPSVADLSAIATDGKQPTTNQKKIYIAAGDGLIYTTSGISNWAEWEDRPDLVYWNNEGDPSYQGRRFSNYPLAVDQSLLGMMGPNNLSGSARLLALNGSVQTTLSSLDDQLGGRPVWAFEVGVNERYIAASDVWLMNRADPTAHSFAIMDDFTNAPIILRRVFHRNYQNSPAFDGFMTSTDFGLTWSTDYFSQVDKYARPQSLTTRLTNGVSVAGKIFAPICTDGTDWFIVQSTNQYSIQPKTLYMNGLELDFIVEEVE